jgi:CheY-like chemotaxis protein
MVLHVLIAEDEALVALSLADLLEAEGHDVTDLNMPGLTGEDLIRAMSAERPSLPVVVVTGSAPHGGLEELRRDSGGHRPLALLHKPFATADLLTALNHASVAARGPG